MTNGPGGLTTLQKIGIICGIPAALATVAGVVWKVWPYIETRHRIGQLEKLADAYQRHDEFEKAIDTLNEAKKLDPEDREIWTRLLEMTTFETSVDYDQVKLVSDKKVLPTLDDDCQQLVNDLGNKPRIIAVCGIVKDLHDWPTDATKEYKNASEADSRYANAHNYWGYTIFRWELGGTEWATDALFHFSKATEIDPTYPLPYMNIAAVYLEQKNPEKAKESLDTATNLLPHSPRVHLLWGHYYTQIGKRLEEENLPESQLALQQAVQHFEDARKENPKVADVHLYLGQAYEKVEREGDALTEYDEATKLDAWNLQACMNHARLLTWRGEPASAQRELQRCERLSAEVEADFTARMSKTTDIPAREWLKARIEEYKEARRLLGNGIPPKSAKRKALATRN